MWCREVKYRVNTHIDEVVKKVLQIGAGRKRGLEMFASLRVDTSLRAERQASAMPMAVAMVMVICTAMAMVVAMAADVVDSHDNQGMSHARRRGDHALAALGASTLAIVSHSYVPWVVTLVIVSYSGRLGRWPRRVSHTPVALVADLGE